jgi:hypothetical protein
MEKERRLGVLRDESSIVFDHKGRRYDIHTGFRSLHIGSMGLKTALK